MLTGKLLLACGVIGVVVVLPYLMYKFDRLALLKVPVKVNVRLLILTASVSPA